jgi:hypothetical protein
MALHFTLLRGTSLVLRAHNKHCKNMIMNTKGKQIKTLSHNKQEEEPESA